MKDYHWNWLLAGILFALFSTIFFKTDLTGYENPVFKETRSDFKAGEIILPDYAHNDTLIVVDPDGLNKAIENTATDWEINYALHRHCAILGQQIKDYGLDVDNEGYTLTDYSYMDTIRVKWGTNFDSLMYKWND